MLLMKMKWKLSDIKKQLMILFKAENVAIHVSNISYKWYKQTSTSLRYKDFI